MLAHVANHPGRNGPVTRVRRGLDIAALIAAREAAGMSVPDLARHAGLSPHAIWRWENESTEPNIVSLRNAVRALNKALSDVLHVPEDKRMLSDLRNLTGLTQPEAAAELGLSTYTYGQIERGVAKLSDQHAALIAKIFGRSEEEVRASYERARNRPAGEPA